MWTENIEAEKMNSLLWAPRLLRKCQSDKVAVLTGSQETQGEILHLRHLQASARELIREAARERGVCVQACLLPNTATPCHHLPAAKVCGNGRSGQRMVRRSGAEREEYGAISQIIQPHAFRWHRCQGPARQTASSACASTVDTQGPGCNMQLGLGPRPSLSFESKGRAKLAEANKAAGARQELDRREPARSRWPCRTEKPISEMEQHILP